jgi:hypothetical protein
MSRLFGLGVIKPDDFASPHGASFQSPAFELAAIAGDAATVALLLDKGVELGGAKRNSCLHCAVAGGHAELVQLLLDRGTKRFLRQSEDDVRVSLVATAVRAGRSDIVKIVGDAGSRRREGREYPVFDAVLTENVELVRSEAL